ncbi:DUF1989 domain-containing protein [Zavarzinia sp. CC-PAN008]|uniref:DUF1989 domain-containing protein n=1 Tax=Zavarzinia sp. CC-PAN008 TaxID=3243332 RepID=UPI003F744426
MTNDTATSPISPDGRPEPGRRYVLPARAGRAVRVGRGQTIRIENPNGTQVVDTWAFVAGDLREVMSMEHLRTQFSRIGIRVGDGLPTNHRRPILEVVEDTSPGVHDTLMSACDKYRYECLGHVGYHDSCTDNLRNAMAAIGLEAPEVPSPLNLFMNIPVHPDGRVSFDPPVSRPGDYVALKALDDVIVVLSACPQDMNPINGDKGPQDAAFVVS